MSQGAGMEMPTFQDAIMQFKDFLKNEGFSYEANWLFSDDVRWHDNVFLVRKPLPKENGALVEKIYESGCKKGLGMEVGIFCLIDSIPFFYIWIPANHQEAELEMLDGLKLSVPIELIEATSVKNRLAWQVYKWIGSRNDPDKWLDKLPQRKQSYL